MKKDSDTISSSTKLKSSENLEVGQKADLGRTPSQQYRNNYSKTAPEGSDDPFDFF